VEYARWIAAAFVAWSLVTAVLIFFARVIRRRRAAGATAAADIDPPAAITGDRLTRADVDEFTRRVTGKGAGQK
jgi:hypothetical protein